MQPEGILCLLQLDDLLSELLIDAIHILWLVNLLNDFELFFLVALFSEPSRRLWHEEQADPVSS